MCAAATLIARGQSNTDTILHLHGSVVNGATDRPIGRALVASADRRLATMTDAEGHWTLDVSVPANPTDPASSTNGRTNAVSSRFGSGFGGGLILTAQRPRYLMMSEMVPVALEASSAEKAITLRLYPGATVQGVASARGQDTSRGLTVALLRKLIVNGRSSWTTAGVRPVDKDGAFHFQDLFPGEYTVMTNEWNPDRSSAEVMNGPTEGFPPIFLGGVTTLVAATKLHLRYGETAQASLRADAATYYPVVVPVQAAGQNRGINVEVNRGDSFSGYRLGWNSRENRVEGALPSGDYTLTLNSFNQTRQSVVVDLHVAGGTLQTAPITLGPALNIPVRVHDERTLDTNASAQVTGSNRNGRGPSQDFFLFLRSANFGNGQNGGGMSMRDGSPVIENVTPGTYIVESSSGRGYIAAVTSGGVDLLHQPLVVAASGADAIDVTLRDGGGTVQGTVSGRGERDRYVLVLLVPTGAGGVAQQAMLTPLSTGSVFSQVLNGPQGGDPAAQNTFHFSNVAPGSYRVLAVVEASVMDGVPYREPEPMRAFDGKGQTITVSAGQTSQVDVAAMPMPGVDR